MSDESSIIRFLFLIKIWISKSVTKPLKSFFFHILCFLGDAGDLLLRRRDSLIPPTQLMFDGPQSRVIYLKNGKEFILYYKKFCMLKPHEKILDVGCGIGRKTIPLTNYLDADGAYEGFDIVKTGIDWCKKKISTKYPNFHFQHADVFNKYYNPNGQYKAAEYKFPFQDEYFDFVVLGSVFTHMLPADMENYFSEIARVLKRGGRCLITFFLFNREALELVGTGKGTLNFRREKNLCWTTNKDTPEEVVAYEETFIVGLYEKYGIKIQGPIQYGAWCGRGEYLSYQDIIIAGK